MLQSGVCHYKKIHKWSIKEIWPPNWSNSWPTDYRAQGSRRPGDVQRNKNLASQTREPDIWKLNKAWGKMSFLSGSATRSATKALAGNQSSENINIDWYKTGLTVQTHRLLPTTNRCCRDPNQNFLFQGVAMLQYEHHPEGYGICTVSSMVASSANLDGM